jgi:hypothetical protein
LSHEHRDQYMWGQESWASWGSPVGLGIFFVLGAIAFDLVRIVLK